MYWPRGPKTKEGEGGKMVRHQCLMRHGARPLTRWGGEKGGRESLGQKNGKGSGKTRGEGQNGQVGPERGRRDRAPLGYLRPNSGKNTKRN